MSLEPGLWDKKYFISEVKLDKTVQGGKLIAKGFGEDYSHLTDNILYILNPAVERLVSFKAFINSFKINLTKEIEKQESVDRNFIPVVQYVADMSIDVSLNIPAHTVNEAVNNIAKIEELQRLLAPLSSVAALKNKSYGKTNNYFSVLFKNLICSGVDYGDQYIMPDSVTINDMMRYGFLCYFESIKFEPDIEAGFFDYEDGQKGYNNDGFYLYPRNIKLNLNLKYGVDSSMFIEGFREQNVPLNDTLLGFLANGHYDPLDLGGFPFCLNVGTKGFIENNSVWKSKDFFSTDEINKFDNYESGYSNKSYLFLSLNIKQDVEGVYNSETASRKRWVVFKGFLESFDRNYSIAANLLEDRSVTMGKILNMQSSNTFKSLEYSIKINIPSASLKEAKKNCAKIQYLFRFFPKSHQYMDSRDQSANTIKVYSPSLIETATTSGLVNPLNFDQMFDNSLNLYLENIGFDIDLEQGFFEENGKLYPKSMSIDLKFFYNNDDLIKNYNLTTEGAMMRSDSSSPIAGSEHLFPFPRQTSKIVLGQ